MDESARNRPMTRRRYPWCCHIGFTPSSPDNLSFSHHKTTSSVVSATKTTLNRKHETTTTTILSKPRSPSVPNSPQSCKSVLSLPGRIHPRRILSPGRVSPIDPDHVAEEIGLSPSPAVGPAPPLRSQSFRAPPDVSSGSGCDVSGVFDLRLNLRGKNGSCLVLELNSEVLSANSDVFAGFISEQRKGSVSDGSSGSRICRIEVPEVENLVVFKETIELMFEEDITKRLMKIGVYRSIDILEVSASIMFTKGVLSCLKYLEAVPWSEDEEEKLRSLFTRFKFDDAATRDIMARLYMIDSADSQETLATQLVWSITSCVDNNARNELKSLVKGLLCKSSVYEKDQPDLKDDLYVVCESCVGSLVGLFEEALETSSPRERRVEKGNDKPMIERISRQVDNINWLLEILLERHMAEEFVDLWGNQGKLVKMHETVSPMVRYEISRVSAALFIAMGTRKLQCRSESRAKLVQSWFSPMLSDFGWLQRRRKGLDMKALEEAMGLTLLTLSLRQQYTLFMEWFRCFSKNGTECPNLSKAFQIWWRRSFVRGSESHVVESRLSNARDFYY